MRLQRQAGSAGNSPGSADGKIYLVLMLLSTELAV